MASLLRPDDLRAPESHAEALAFLRSRAPRSATALAACAAMVRGSVERRDFVPGPPAPSHQDNARTIP